MFRPEDNLLLNTDSYKFTHAVQYPPRTTNVYSYLESRVGSKFPYTVFFGLQYQLKRYLEGQVVTMEKIDEAEKIVNAHIGPGMFNRKGWEYILGKYKGKLPLRIKAVPEGTPVPIDNVLMTVENTDPNCYWLTNYIETLLVQVWYPCTVATLSREAKRTINEYLVKTGNPALLPFKLHDFGFRGVSSIESAGIGGAAHLVNFMGSDTVAALLMAKDYYNCPMAGFSIPASEHSTITSWGKEHEADAMNNMLEKYPKGLVACVSDSWSIENAVKKIWGSKLKNKVLARDGCLVIRPDSGDPVAIVTSVVKDIAEVFGAYKNDKGYLVLNDHVRVIQGDGCTLESIGKMLFYLEKAGYSADNVAFGMGGGLLQQLNRDTQRFAFKCSSITIDGEEREVFKQPVTDPTKNSKKGRLELYKLDTGDFMTDSPGKDFGEGQITGEPILETVFENGEIKKEYTFDEVRKNAGL